MIILNENKEFHILIDKYFPSSIICENKNIIHYQKKNKKKKNKEDKYNTKITEYFEISDN